MALSGKRRPCLHEVRGTRYAADASCELPSPCRWPPRSSEQRRCPVSFVIVTVTAQRSPVRHCSDSPVPAPAPGSRLFIDAKDDRVLRRHHVEPDHVGRLGGRTPDPGSHQDLRPGRDRSSGLARSARYTAHRHRRVPRPERSRPAGITLWLWADPNPPECVGPFLPWYFGSAPRSARFVEAVKPPFAIAHAPLRCLSRSCSLRQPDRSACHALCAIARCGRVAVTGVPLRRTHQALKARAVLRRSR